MPGGDRCTVGGCNNDRRYKEKQVVRSHVSHLQFHVLPRNEIIKNRWVKSIEKGRVDFKPGKHITVCSNHFVDAEPTSANPVPTLFMTESDSNYLNSPKKRRSIIKSTSQPVKRKLTDIDKKDSDSENETETKVEKMSLCLKSIQLTRDADVHFYTGLQSTDMFGLLFDHLKCKASTMQYWKGEKQTEKETPVRYKAADSNQASTYSRPGPDRKLPLEHEFLLVMMRLRLGLLTHDLSIRFGISDSLTSSIFFTWVRLMRLELSCLIIWPPKEVVRVNLPECFRKFYPKVRCIIDCSEVFIETPSSLELQAQCYSDYKHHTTIKFLVSVTPNGMFSYISPCYGGRASDKFIVKDCGFLKLIEPFDQVMTDRGFKIKEDLMMVQAKLAIPPSTIGSLQMTRSDVSETSKIANVRIYVEQAIGRLKTFRILKNEIPVSCLPVCDDIIIVCAACCNLLDPLCV